MSQSFTTTATTEHFDAFHYGGPCKRCGRDHYLTAGEAAPFAFALMKALEQYRHIAFAPEAVAGFTYPAGVRRVARKQSDACNDASCIGKESRLAEKMAGGTVEIASAAPSRTMGTTVSGVPVSAKHVPPDTLPDDPRLCTDALFSEARGQMFGVMVCIAPDGTREVWRAFSGQFNGVWQVDGWVPSLVSEQRFLETVSADEAQIKAIGRDIKRLQNSASSCDESENSFAMPEQSGFEHNGYGNPKVVSNAEEGIRYLKKQRAELSRQLMKRIHALYELPSFRGVSLPLDHVFSGKGIPTGTADCCAPKLLANAALHGYVPVSMAEFYWGRTNRSGTKEHGRLYPSCTDKCRPILGHMLCGLGDS